MKLEVHPGAPGLSSGGWGDEHQRMLMSKRRRGRADLREEHWSTYMTICNMENAGSLMDDAGHPRSMLCDNLEGWGGRSAQEGGDTSVPVADSY